MKRWIRRVLAFVLIGALLGYATGPRVAIDSRVRVAELPQDLEAYLRATEAGVPDLKSGTEKTIVWADPMRRTRTPLSLIYLHGFSASRQEIRPLCENLARSLDANLFYTRLTGHGRSAEALGEATVHAWLTDTAEALAMGRRLGERVIVIGTSTGATLATWLAAQPGNEDIFALILMSPNYGPSDISAEFLLMPWAERLAPLVAGPNWSWEPANDLQARYWTTRYPTRALLPMMGVVKLAREATLDGVETPTLMLYSPQDRIVDPGKIVHTFQRFGAEHKVLIAVQDPDDPQRHILAGDILSARTTQAVTRVILDFLAPLNRPSLTAPNP